MKVQCEECGNSADELECCPICGQEDLCLRCSCDCQYWHLQLEDAEEDE